MSNKNQANTVILQRPDYSEHNMTEELKTSTHIGRLTPVYFQEVVPGDEVDLNAEFFTKFRPMVAPAFQNFHAMIEYYYVPWRIIWPNWEYFIQNENAPGATAPPIHPYADLTGENPDWFENPQVEAVHPYFGFNMPDNLSRINMLPYAAYQLIYNEYYRHPQIHENNKDSLRLADGDQAAKLPLLRKLRYRTYKDDYFTMALQSPQLGEAAAIELSTSEMLPVYRNQNPSPNPNINVAATYAPGGGSAAFDIPLDLTSDTSILGAQLYVNPADGSFNITMNDLIHLQRMQEFLVRKNLSGNRYNEYILAMFGIQVPDLRVDRPDFIGGIKAPVSISEVVNMGSDTLQGWQSGQGNAYAEGGRSNYKVLEHGIIMGIYSCIPQQAYMFAVPRLFLKQEFEDYYACIFDQMGERPILNMELAQYHSNPTGTFGYVPQFSEYRVPYNKVGGAFTNGDLGKWHLAVDYPDDVQLDEQFFDIENPDMLFNVTAETADAILLWVVNKVFIKRPMKKFSMPVLTNEYGNNFQ